MAQNDLHNKIRQYFRNTLSAFGRTPAGVDWNSERSQYIRFEQISKIFDPKKDFTLIDYGCGYGALVDYLDRNKYCYQYTGYDLLPEMIETARQQYSGRDNCYFTDQEVELKPADYSVASGIFNLKLDTPEQEWVEYVVLILEKLNALSKGGFSFNMLTSYSDQQMKHLNLYYGDPEYFFDLCVRRYSRKVALLHDYELYDFTILVRKDKT